jgi:hypothetical protein
VHARTPESGSAIEQTAFWQSVSLKHVSDGVWQEKPSGQPPHLSESAQSTPGPHVPALQEAALHVPTGSPHTQMLPGPQSESREHP